MPNAISSIIRSSCRRPDEPLNVLSFCVHERYQSCLGLLPHHFYLIRGPNLKDWETKYATLPKNTTLLSKTPSESQLPPDIDYDIILSQNKFGQYAIAKDLSRRLHIPLISLEHTLPHPGWTQNHTQSLTRLRGNVNVFLSEYSRRNWNWPDDDPYEIIEPGIDSGVFTPEYSLPKKPVILSVVNDWINRDVFCGFNLWRKVTHGLPVMVLGDTPGLSKPAETTGHLVSAYQQCQVFLNTSLVSTCPFTLLEAMACGCAVVSTATTMIPQIIQDGVNGFCSNNPDVLKKRLDCLLENPELCEKLGREARKTIEERYSFGRMASEWDKLFKKTAGIIITGEEK